MSKQCTVWLDGLYLLSNTTNTYENEAHLTYWVPDCTLADPHYTNNPDTQEWECKFFLSEIERILHLLVKSNFIIGGYLE